MTRQPAARDLHLPHRFAELKPGAWRTAAAMAHAAGRASSRDGTVTRVDVAGMRSDTDAPRAMAFDPSGPGTWAHLDDARGRSPYPARPRRAWNPTGVDLDGPDGHALASHGRLQRVTSLVFVVLLIAAAWSATRWALASETGATPGSGSFTTAPPIPAAPRATASSKRATMARPAGRVESADLHPGAKPSCMTVNDEARRVAVAFEDGAVALYDTTDGSLLETWCIEGGVPTSLHIDRRGARVLIGTASHGVHLGHHGDPRTTPLVDPHIGPVTGVAFVRGGVITAGADGAVVLFGDFASRVLREGGSEVTTIAVSPEGDRLAVAVEDGTLTVYDLLGATNPIVLDGAFGAASALTFSPDGRLVASAGPTGATVWSLEPARVRAVLPEMRGLYTSLSFDGDGRQLVAASRWSIDRADLAAHAVSRSVTPGGRMVALAPASHGVQSFASDGRHTSPGWSGTPTGEAGVVATCAVATHDGRMLRGDADGNAVWLDRDGAVQQRFRAHRAPIVAIAVDERTRRMATAGADGMARVWDLDSGRCVRTVRGFAGQTPDSLALSRDGNTLALVGRTKCEILDVDSGKRLGRIVGRDMTTFAPVAVAFLPGSDDIITVDATGILTRSDHRGRRVDSFTSGVNPTRLTCSPDGRFIAVASDTGEVVVTTPRFRSVNRTQLHRGPVLSLVFDPMSSERLVTGGADGQMRLVEHTVSRPLGSWRPFGGNSVETLCASNVNGRIAAFDGSGTLVAFDATGGAAPSSSSSAGRLAIVEDRISD